jgi:hypothetical protein
MMKNWLTRAFDETDQGCMIQPRVGIFYRLHSMEDTDVA